MATYRSWTLPDIKTHPHSLPVAAQLHSATNEIFKFLPNTHLAIVEPHTYQLVKRSSTIKEIQQPHYLIDQEYHKTEQMLSQAAFKG